MTGTVAALGGVPLKLFACGAGAVLAGTICAFAYLISPPSSLAGSKVHFGGADGSAAATPRLDNTATPPAMARAIINDERARAVMPLMSSSLNECGCAFA